MAIAECRECGADVSTKAKACPKCGRPDPVKSSGGMGGTLGLILFVGFGVLAFAGRSSDDGDDARVEAATEEPQVAEPSGQGSMLHTLLNGGGPDVQAEAEPEPVQASDAECIRDISCWGDRHHTAATIACQRRIKDSAQYQMRWTDGLLGAKFTRFLWADESAGTLTYYGDEAEFQNGYGAWRGVRYWCDYDPANSRVTAVRVE